MKALGAFFLLFTALATSAAASRIEAVDGSGQRAVIGERYGKRLTAQAFDAEGGPAAFVRVVFRAPASGAPTVTFDTFQAQPYTVVTLTDRDGFVASPGFTAGFGLGTGTITAELLTDAGTALATTAFTFTNTLADGEVTAIVQDMWWAGRAENGWGMSVVQHGERLVNVIFAYDLEGSPTWYVMPGGEWEHGFASTFAGPLYATTGAPFFAYDASRVAAGPALGTLRMSFNGPDVMFLDDGLGLGFFPHKRMFRQPFAADIGARNLVTPLKGVGDMWWGGPSQNGWGLAILEQPGNLFIVWYTYDEQSRPTWFVMGGEWVDETTFAGGVYQARSSPWSGRSYDASQWGALTVGNHRLRFLDSQNATLEYSVQGHSGTLSLVRQPF